MHQQVLTRETDHRGLRSTINGACVVFTVVLLISGCSSSSKDKGDSPGTTSTTLSTAFNKLPATASVNGAVLEVTSTPRSGKVGKTFIKASASLKGSVQPGTLRFDVSDEPDATTGEPVFASQSVKVSSADRYPMPNPVKATRAGRWSVTVTFTPDAQGSSTFSVSGLPPIPETAPPFPQLVTVVSR